MFGFKVATINLRGRTNRWLARRHLLVGQMVDARPDIVGLQEISLSISQGSWLTRQVNYRLAGDSRRPYRIIQTRHQKLTHMFEGIGIMTRLPIIYYDAIPLGYGGQVAIRANIELPAGAAGSRRQSLDFVSVRLHHGRDYGQTRLEQVMNLVGRLNEKRRVPLQVIAGDFNEGPDGLGASFMNQSYRSVYAEAHGWEPLATYPTGLLQPQPIPAQCLDYVFVSPAVGQVTSAAIFADEAAVDDDTLFASDHVGLLVGLEV